MSPMAFRAAIRPPRLMLVAMAVLGLLIVSALLSTVSLTIAVAIVGCFAAVCLGLTLVSSRQYAVVAAICIAVGIFVDWYPVLPYPFGGSGIPIAPILALFLFTYMLTVRRVSPTWITSLPIWNWAALCVLAAPAILASDSLQNGLNYFGAIFVAPMIFLLLGIAVANSENNVRTLLTWLTALAAVVAIHTLIEATTGIFLFETTFVQQYLATFQRFTLVNTSVSRAGSFLLNPDANGTFLSIIAFLPIGLFSLSRSRFAKGMYAAAFAVILLALMSTYAVGPMLSFAAATLCLIVLWPRTGRRIRFIAVITATFIAIYEVFPSQADLIVQHGTGPTELGLRSAIWATAVRMIVDNPITGIGLGQNTYMARENFYRVTAQYTLEPQPHNSYLEITAYAGLIVAITYGILWLRALIPLVRQRVDKDHATNSVRIIVLACVVALSINSLQGEGWTLYPVAWIVWLLIGAATSRVLFKSHQSDATAIHTYADKSARMQATKPTQAVSGVKRRSDLPKNRGLASEWVGVPFHAGQMHSPPALRRKHTWLEGTTSIHEDLVSLDGAVGGLDIDIADLPTQVIPALRPQTADTWELSGTAQVPIVLATRVESQLKLLIRLIKDSGAYALVSVVSPMISILLSPFLTRQLSSADYGTLTILNTSMALVGLITQAGLGSALIRAYTHDYTSAQDRREVLTAAMVLTCLITVPVGCAFVVFAPALASLILHQPARGDIVILSVTGLALQNLTAPGFAWLRSDNRRLTYAFLSIANLVVTLAANLVFVGLLQMGIAGSVMANIGGYGVVVMYLVPAMARHAGGRIRQHMMWEMLTFGLPHVPSLISYWVLQLADRYLLSVLGSLQQVGAYSIGYSLGWALTTILVSPFVLAWPTTLYAIAKRKDAPKVFQLVFRIYAMLLIFGSLSWSLIAPVLLNALYPKSYQRAGPVVPIISASAVMFGLYYTFMVGATILRKPWVFPLYYGAAALVNVGANILLIPAHGMVGAAWATLLGYALLAVLTYIGNQIMYPIPFEIGRVLFGAILATGLYILVAWQDTKHATQAMWWVNISAVLLYAVIAVWIVLGPTGIARSSHWIKARFAEVTG